MLTFIINLERHAERRQYITAHFKRYNIHDFTLMTAVDAQQLTDEAISQAYDPIANKQRYRRGLSYGEIACTLSHLRCYQQLVNSGEKGAFIFEDDCKVNRYTYDVMQQIEKTALPANALVILQYVARFKKTPLHRLNSQYTLHETAKAECAHGYYITRQAAINMLVEFDKIAVAIDQWQQLNKNKVIKLLMVYPFCVGLEPKFSQASALHEGRVDAKKQRSKKLSNKVARLLKPLVKQKTLRTVIERSFLGIAHQLSGGKHFD